MRGSQILLVSTLVVWGKAISWSDDKVVGGFTVNISEVPYVVSVQIKRDPAKDDWHPICAGTLLSALYVITACHCVASVNSAGVVVSPTGASLSNWLFLAGAVDVSYPWQRNPLGQSRTPKSILPHPSCELCLNAFLISAVSINDVAVAKMSTPFELNAYVKPAEIYSLDRGLFHDKLEACMVSGALENVMSGWGLIVGRDYQEDFLLNGSSNGTKGHCGRKISPSNNKLYRMEGVLLENDTSCYDAFQQNICCQIKNYLNTSWANFSSSLNRSLQGQICATTGKSNYGPCDGDDGAGIICDNRYIMGVYSWTIGCDNLIPAVVQNLLSVLSWLKAKCCSYSNCEDYLYRIKQCGPSPDERFENCTIPTTTSTTSTTMASTTTPGIITRIPQNSALTISPYLVMILTFNIVMHLFAMLLGLAINNVIDQL